MYRIISKISLNKCYRYGKIHEKKTKYSILFVDINIKDKNKNVRHVNKCENCFKMNFNRMCNFKNKNVETVQQNAEEIIMDVFSLKKRNVLLDRQLDTASDMTFIRRHFWRKTRKPRLKKTFSCLFSSTFGDKNVSLFWSLRGTKYVCRITNNRGKLWEESLSKRKWCIEHKSDKISEQSQSGKIWNVKLCGKVKKEKMSPPSSF